MMNMETATTAASNYRVAQKSENTQHFVYS